jgi:ESCRT-II complex subunit VPS25
MSTFNYPVLYDFPPFFTRQPHEETWQRQKQIWLDFLIAYGQHEHVFELTPSHPIFKNKKLSRNVQKEMFVELMEELVIQNRGEWIHKPNNGPNTTFLCYCRPIEEWARLLLKWAKDTHMSPGFICTAYELVHGQNIELEPFYMLHPLVFWRVIQYLEQYQCVATNLKDKSETSRLEYGIKFLSFSIPKHTAG